MPSLREAQRWSSHSGNWFDNEPTTNECYRVLFPFLSSHYLHGFPGTAFQKTTRTKILISESPRPPPCRRNSNQDRGDPGCSVEVLESIFFLSVCTSTVKSISIYLTNKRQVSIFHNLYSCLLTAFRKPTAPF